MYALGWTHHCFGVQLIRAAAMLQLLLGNVGVRAADSTRFADTPTSRAGPTAAWRITTCPATSDAQKADHAKLDDYLDKSTPWTLNKMARAS